MHIQPTGPLDLVRSAWVIAPYDSELQECYHHRLNVLAAHSRGASI
jgi:hypothetical protein